MSLPIGEILFLVFLTFLEGFFVAAEIALVSVRRSRIDQLVEEGSSGARRVRKLIDDPGRFLAVSQLGLTLIGFFASAFAAVSLVDGLARLLESLGVAQAQAESAALIVVTIILALFTIVFAELIPKAIALGAPERFALILSRPIDVLARVLGPVVSVLNGITRWVARSLGVELNQEASISAEELRLIVERGGEQGVLEAEEEQMINAVIELGDRRVHEVMVPRVAIASVPADATLEEAIDLVVEVGHSRIPVYHDTIDEIVGILYAKDLLPYLKRDAGPRPALRKLLRPPVLVPESMTVDDLLHEFQRRKVHIAVVLDEYGGTAGLVTIEDLLEEIVGEIRDEYDVESEPIVDEGSGRFVFSGKVNIDEVAQRLDIEIEREGFETVGGYLLSHLGRVPAKGERFELDGLSVEVIDAERRRINKVRMCKLSRRGAEDIANAGVGERAMADRRPS